MLYSFGWSKTEVGLREILQKKSARTNKRARRTKLRRKIKKTRYTPCRIQIVGWYLGTYITFNGIIYANVLFS